MNPADHPPPHFHARYAEHTASLSIANCEVLDGQLPSRAFRLIEEWHQLHQAELEENWRRFEAGLPFLQIAPL